VYRLRGLEKRAGAVRDRSNFLNPDGDQVDPLASDRYARYVFLSLASQNTFNPHTARQTLVLLRQLNR
jgi:hypothetical protein